jgi:broad specificity phosphatase PhoE
MTTFLLIRHGETDAVGRSIMGWAPGWHLNDSGRAQVKRLAERLAALPIRAIYTSPLERAVETAEAIGGPHGLTLRKDDDFGEFHAGEWQGISLADLDKRDDWRRFNAVRSLTRAPGGELAIETQARVVRKIQELAGRHAGETVAVVSHGDPLRSAIAYFLGMPLDFLLRFEVHPASLSVVEVGEWGAKVLCVNDRGGEVSWRER